MPRLFDLWSWLLSLDWKATVPTWVSALGGLAGFSALSVTLFQGRRRRRLPPPELLDLLLRLQEDFSSIIAEGGKPQLWFLEEERQRSEIRLAAIAGLLVDDKLNEYVGRARMAYADCFTWSRSPAGATPNATQEQHDAASEGRAAVVKSIDRMNFLIRKFGNS